MGALYHLLSPNCGRDVLGPAAVFFQLQFCFLLGSTLDEFLGCWGKPWSDVPAGTSPWLALTINSGMHLAFSIPDSAYSHSCTGSTDLASHSTWACPGIPSVFHSQASISSAKPSLGRWPHGLQAWWMLALRALFLLQ